MPSLWTMLAASTFAAFAVPPGALGRVFGDEPTKPTVHWMEFYAETGGAMTDSNIQDPGRAYDLGEDADRFDRLLRSASPTSERFSATMVRLRADYGKGHLVLVDAEGHVLERRGSRSRTRVLSAPAYVRLNALMSHRRDLSRRRPPVPTHPAPEG